MRYAIHQLHIDLMSYTAAGFITGRRCLGTCCCVVNRCIPVDCPVNELVCLTDSVGYLTFDHFFTIETFHWNLGICCDNNTVCISNLLICQHILCTTGSAGFNLHKAVLCFCSFFNSFCCHVRMCDTGRTGSNSKDLRLCSFC